jgi:hypothetical protein
MNSGSRFTGLVKISGWILGWVVKIVWIKREMKEFTGKEQKPERIEHQRKGQILTGANLLGICVVERF